MKNDENNYKTINKNIDINNNEFIKNITTNINNIWYILLKKITFKEYF